MTRSKTEVRAKAELPDAVYAAAGASDLAYKRLRHLPEATARTLRTAGQTAGALRDFLRSLDTQNRPGPGTLDRCPPRSIRSPTR